MSILPNLLTSFSHTCLPSTVKQASVPVLQNVHTCLPSVQHDAEASVTSAPPGFGYRFAPVPESFAFHCSLPSVPTHRATTSLPSTEVTKILLPHTTGVQAPMPGILNFQTTFL